MHTSFQQVRADSFLEVHRSNWIYRLSLFWLAALLATSCHAEDMKTYQENQIQELYIEKMTDGTLMLTAMPILESLYSCPGAILKEAEDATLVSLVRCRMNAECPVDIVATPDPTKPGNYSMALPGTDKPVKIDYHSGAVQVWP